DFHVTGVQTCALPIRGDRTLGQLAVDETRPQFESVGAQPASLAHLLQHEVADQHAVVEVHLRWLRLCRGSGRSATLRGVALPGEIGRASWRAGGGWAR